jgi:hypothetical protein
MIDAIKNARLDPRTVATSTHLRAYDAHPGVSGAVRTTAASHGGLSATITPDPLPATRSHGEDHPGNRGTAAAPTRPLMRRPTTFAIAYAICPIRLVNRFLVRIVTPPDS